MGTNDFHEILQGEQVTPTMNLRWWGTKHYKRPALQQEFIVQFFKDGVLIENKNARIDRFCAHNYTFSE